jgi:phage virion morphogenesis protein
MTSIRWRIEDDLSPAIRARIKALDDLSPVMAGIATLMEDSIRERLTRTNVGPDGTPWRPSERFKRTGVGATLVETGIHLEQRLSAQSGRAFATAGTNAVIARAHQFGDNQTRQVREHVRVIREAFGKPLDTPKTVTVKAHDQRRNLPARPFIGFSAEDRERIIEMLTDYIAGEPG